MEERDGGTLRCHYRHRVHDDPFWFPGLSDITSHVDFTAVAEAGFEAGLEAGRAAGAEPIESAQLLREASSSSSQRSWSLPCPLTPSWWGLFALMRFRLARSTLRFSSALAPGWQQQREPLRCALH